MALPDDYLEYSRRQHGMDNDRYGWTPATSRAPLRLKSGAKAAAFIVVPVEFFPLNPPDTPFKHPGAMKTPYPDLRHFTVRDYGNRIGVFRILKELSRAGLKATFAINAEIATRYPPLIKAITDAGHEIAAHGVSTAHIHHDGLSGEDETALIAQCKAALPNATSWMSPARNESYRTPDLIADAGYTVCLDWEADQRPITLSTKTGQLTSLPLMSELGDFKLMVDRGQQDEAWAKQIIEAAAFHVDEYAAIGAQCFGFTLTPYIVGQPFRIKSLRHVLTTLVNMDGLSVMTATETATAFEETTS